MKKSEENDCKLPRRKIRAFAKNELDVGVRVCLWERQLLLLLLILPCLSLSIYIKTATTTRSVCIRELP